MAPIGVSSLLGSPLQAMRYGCFDGHLPLCMYSPKRPHSLEGQMIITARAPVRIDFAGAWTDVPIFADSFGGATINAAIDIYVSGQLRAAEGEKNGIFDQNSNNVSRPSGKYTPSADDPLVVSYGSEIPAGSGLGTSATLNVVWLSLVRREKIDAHDDRMHIAELAYQTEKTLGIIGGKQDQYASAVGGINLFQFTADDVTCVPVQLPPEQIEDLENRLLLCYTGKARLSSNIHRNVWDNFQAGKRETLDALFGLRQSAYDAKEALGKWDLQSFARIVTEQRHYMKDLDASTSNEQIEQIFDLVNEDILGGKPCGAGGGGCLFFITRDPNAKEAAREKLVDEGLVALDIAFDFEGIQVTYGKE